MFATYKLAYLCAEYPNASKDFGGIGVAIQTEAEWFAARGVDVTVICPTSHSLPGHLVQNNVKVHITSPGNLPKLRAVTTRWRSAKEIAMVLGSTPGVAVCAEYGGPLLFKPFRQPLIVQFHGSATLLNTAQHRATPRTVRLAEARTIRLADAYQSVSAYAYKRTAELFLCSSKPALVLPNAVDTSIFYPSSSNVDKHTVLFVSKRLSKLKGLFTLAAAMRSVFARFPRARLVLIGSDSFDHGGSLASQFLCHLPSIHRSQVHFAGQLEPCEVASWMRRATLLVIPSQVETLSIVALEAMASSRPIVAAARGGLAELVSNGVTGILADPDHPDSFGRAIIDLLSNPQLANCMGETGYKLVLSRYTKDHIYQQTMHYHVSLIRSHSVLHNSYQLSRRTSFMHAVGRWTAYSTNIEKHTDSIFNKHS